MFIHHKVPNKVTDKSKLTEVVLITDNEHEECVWVTETSKGRYRLENQPMFHSKICLGDIVELEKKPRYKMPVIKRVAESSGKKSIGIKADQQSECFLVWLGARFEMGCKFNGVNDRIGVLSFPADREREVILDESANAKAGVTTFTLDKMPSVLGAGEPICQNCGRPLSAH